MAIKVPFLQIQTMIKKIAKVTLIILAAIVLVSAILSISATILVNKNANDWIGRKATTSYIIVNLLSGSIHIKGLTLYEENEQDHFIKCDNIYVNISLVSLPFQKYKVEAFEIRSPEIIIHSDSSGFNYDDLIQQDTSSPDIEKEETKTSQVIKYILNNFEIKNGSILYQDAIAGGSIGLNNINFSLPHYSWNSKTIGSNLGLSLSSGGSIQLQSLLNLEDSTYNILLNNNALELSVLTPFLKGYLNMDTIQGQVNCDLALNGSISKTDDIKIKGSLSAKNFEIKELSGRPIAKIDLIRLSIDSINSLQKYYNIDTFLLSGCSLDYYLFDSTDNFSALIKTNSDTTSANMTLAVDTIMLEDSSITMNISIDTVITDSNNTNATSLLMYNINTLRINNTQLQFADYTLKDTFEYLIDNISFSADSITNRKDSIAIIAHASLNKKGKMTCNLTINPNDYYDMTLDLLIDSLDLVDFSPYSIQYTGRPIEKGILSYTNASQVKNHKLISKNAFNQYGIALGKKIKEDGIENLPVKQALGILKDRLGNIHLDIPIEGDLDDPKFKLGKTVLKTLKNLVIKTVSAPVTVTQKAMEKK